MKKFLAITLLELIVTLSIAAVLALVTYSSLSEVKIKYRRKEAQTELVKIKALIQEQAVKYNCATSDIATWFASGSVPATCPALPTPTTGRPYIPGNAPFYTSPNKLYAITLDTTSTLSDTAGIAGIKLIAKAISTGPQAKDTDCPEIYLITSMGITEDDKSPATCWQ